MWLAFNVVFEGSISVPSYQVHDFRLECFKKKDRVGSLRSSGPWCDTVESHTNIISNYTKQLKIVTKYVDNRIYISKITATASALFDSNDYLVQLRIYVNSIKA